MLLRRVLAEIKAGSRARVAHECAPVLRSATLALAPSAAALALARRAVDALLGEAPIDPTFLFNLRLVTSELVKNAVLYGSSDEQITLELRLLEREVEVCVANRGERLRLVSLRGRRDTGGRGLEIVDALVDAFAIESTGSGTTIMVRLARAATQQPVATVSAPQRAFHAGPLGGGGEAVAAPAANTRELEPSVRRGVRARRDEGAGASRAERGRVGSRARGA
jgi:anti-sigma regulatory factor (Ser/Thr protein kinase)